MTGTCPHFSTFEEKVANKDMGAHDKWRFVTRSKCSHEAHRSNGASVVGAGPKCGGETGKCEIDGLWQA